MAKELLPLHILVPTIKHELILDTLRSC